ncbi:MAG: flagellar basal body-associated protein FliL [Thiobacillus sp.]|nr:flagellar basal body-associated protein FliL [Thiobacillus sp.]
MSEQAPAAEEAAPKKSKKKLFIILGVVVLLAGGGAGAWFMTQAKPAPGEAKVEPQKPPVFMPLETFTVNLQGGVQYLQTDITLQVSDPAQIEEIKLHMPRVRSRLLALLSSKNAEDLATAENKKSLAKEIMAQVTLPFYPKGKPQKVDDVLFTTFVIQ